MRFFTVNVGRSVAVELPVGIFPAERSLNKCVVYNLMVFGRITVSYKRAVGVYKSRSGRLGMRRNTVAELIVRAFDRRSATVAFEEAVGNYSAVFDISGNTARIRIRITFGIVHKQYVA